MEQSAEARYIDPTLATLEGEASDQERHPRDLVPKAAEAWHTVPSQYNADGLEPTYYDKPAIKQPVWIWAIPTYFYVGGVAGAAMVMGMAAQVFGGKQMRAFDERCRWVGAIGGGIGSGLLIHDLGRKGRFLFMLRVFRPTSPMSMGSWVLAAATPLSAGSAMLTFSKGFMRRVGHAAGIGAGFLGLPLATYTGVLISNTAVPLWQQARRSLPVLFGASSVASMGALFELMNLDQRERRIMDQFALAGRMAELGAAILLEQEMAGADRVSKPLREGVSGTLWTAAKALTAASLVISLLPGKWRGRRLLAGSLGTLGGICLRFAVFHAGRASASDPRATFRQQRAGLGAAEVTGRAAVTGPIRPLPHPANLEEFSNVGGQARFNDSTL
jgi:formate-dependent nitrite reductase membrane component NrfD